ncbi:alpha/beta hydrolase [Sphingomonas sp. 37zxx]|uniref:alpha/beta hydrolase n=1 Tax=Sphingomonas sp. 37zxx TaxID=1550073 RepID=UPI000A9A5124|nr:alpha/beta hydrolase [Sphingomonas sp. 37zxx]
MKRIPLRIDVTEIFGGGSPQHIAGTLFAPETVSMSPQIVMFAAPGGGYSQGYYDIRFDGLSGYSQAEHHIRQGIVLIAFDPLGVGQSSVDRLADLTVEILAETGDLFVRTVMERLLAGTLEDALAVPDTVFVVGVGQSLGGGLTILMQGRHASFDAIIVLGKSAIHTQLPQPSRAQFAATRTATLAYTRDTPADQQISDEAAGAIVDYAYAFHWGTEPQALRDADLATGFNPRRITPPWGSATMPIVRVMRAPGALRDDAAKVTVPVLLAFGERDVSADVRLEATAFPHSNDITLLVVPRMAHMHNFADTRALLWRRIVDWARSQAPAPADTFPEPTRHETA